MWLSLKTHRSTDTPLRVFPIRSKPDRGRFEKPILPGAERLQAPRCIHHCQAQRRRLGLRPRPHRFILDAKVLKAPMFQGKPFWGARQKIRKNTYIWFQIKTSTSIDAEWQPVLHDPSFNQLRRTVADGSSARKLSQLWPRSLGGRREANRRFRQSASASTPPWNTMASNASEPISRHRRASNPPGE